MQLKQRINAFVNLGQWLRENASETDIEMKSSEKIMAILKRAEAENGWFTQDSIRFALKSWGEALSEENLHHWASSYKIENPHPKTVAIIMAGNIPLVGFHDFLSVLLTGNKVLAKLSSNDRVLLPYLAEILISFEGEFNGFISFSEEKLTDFDAVIATGSNNTARYFEYYFGKYPHIIRKNRNSVAVLTGAETEDDLLKLADDIFRYFGLGCRNVSKLYVPKNYDFELFFKAMFSWKDIIHNHKYINNYDYNKAVYLMDGLPLLDNEFMLLKNDSGFSSPISVVFYEHYESLESLSKTLKSEAENIQCIVSKAGIPGEVAFGKAQNPELWEYADGVDTVAFLLKLP
ncbi:acyl-CoA reductase [Vitellibacter sp. q18]|nr:acyl-CoA reductase [Aequorivita lutea]